MIPSRTPSIGSNEPRAVVRNASSGAITSSSAITSAARCVVLTASLAALLNLRECDAAVASLWRFVKDAWWFRLESFEPLLVVATWTLVFGAFYLLDTRCAWAQRYRIQPPVVDDRSHWKYEGAHRKWEILLYILPLVGFDCFVSRRAGRIEAAAEPPSFPTLVIEVLAALVVYDLLFCGVHVACHRIPFLYRNVHAKHHAKSVQRVTEALRLSAVEEALDVGCSIAALNLLQCHPLSRAVYNIVIVYLVNELHCGYDMPWMLQNVVPGQIVAGSVRHEAHHKHGKRYFQKFFTYLDDGLGLST